jgi:hypothetical protein
VARWVPLQPIKLFTRVTFSFFAAMIALSR